MRCPNCRETTIFTVGHGFFYCYNCEITFSGKNNRRFHIVCNNDIKNKRKEVKKMEEEIISSPEIAIMYFLKMLGKSGKDKPIGSDEAGHEERRLEEEELMKQEGDNLFEKLLEKK